MNRNGQDVRFDRTLDAAAPCPACDALGLSHFYQLDGIPTTSNLLMPTRDDALNWPKANLRLAMCRACGFITNTSFDPATQNLTARYEATQACSPTFGKFATQLAQRWIDQYHLRGKRILEIGCGQGEFLSMMCDMANATGWGFDPIVDSAKSTGRVKLVPAKYGEGSAVDVDFIVCRHTLEHIPDVRRFVGSVRSEVGSGRDVTLAIEVPDTLRVLEEAAFWDIYYEHCSYFTPDSLTSLLRRCGFEIADVRLEFGGQYLIAEATPGVDRGNAGAVAVPDIHEFGVRCAAKLRLWRRFFEDHREEVIVVWGSGSKAVGFLTTLGINTQVAAVVDINPAKHGTFLPGSGHEIVARERLMELRPSQVIVMNPIYETEITASLLQMGLKPAVTSLK